jgi:two-component system chemotaxis response regulator CheY
VAPGSEALVTGQVLVVDDDDAILEVVAVILQEVGYAVKTAQNGADALAMVEQAVPALVLLDMRMPVLDGWGFAAALAEREIRVPIVVMSAAQHASSWAAEIAAAGCLAKPFELSELLTVVDRALPA